MYLQTLFFISMENRKIYYFHYLFGVLTVIGCSVTNHHQMATKAFPKSFMISMPSFSFYHINGKLEAEYRIAERGLRDSVLWISDKLIDVYFPGKQIQRDAVSKCMDYKMHRGNRRDEYWKNMDTYKCLKQDSIGSRIMLFIMFEDDYGSTIGMSNPPSSSWIGVRIMAIEDDVIFLDKYIYDAMTISRRQEKYMMNAKSYNPYFPNEQIFKVINRVFEYLQKELK